jgi:hypothetical protein
MWNYMIKIGRKWIAGGMCRGMCRGMSDGMSWYVVRLYISSLPIERKTGKW